MKVREETKLQVKQKIFRLIEVDYENDTKMDEIYSYAMLSLIISLLPLFTREENVFSSCRIYNDSYFFN